MDTTRLILKSHTSLGVANGATKPPEGYVRAVFFLVLIQKVRHLFYRLVMARVGTPENDEHADSVLIDELHRLLWIESVFTLLTNRYQTALDIKVPSEFFESDLGVCAHNDVWTRLVDRKALFLALLLPQTFHGEAS